MKQRNILGFFLAFAMILGLAATAFAYSSLVIPGVTYYDPAKAQGCFTLIDGNGLKLIDMNGNVVHDWTPFLKHNNGNQRGLLLPNGHVLAMRRAPSAVQPGVPFIYELDWDGNLVWSYEGTQRANPHHDVRRLDNGNTLTLIRDQRTAAEVAVMGIKDFPGNEWFSPMRRTGVGIAGDKIIEVTPANEIVWEWSTFDDPWFDINRFSPIDTVLDWVHCNTCSILPENKWYDAGDVRFRPGNIILNPRNFDEFVIIDKETRRVVWSHQSDFQGGLAHPHEPIMIEKGLPGAGNILVFDNGLFPKNRDHSGQSYILEINPREKEIVWIYGAENFYSNVGAVQHRLPNGNTFIVETTTGRLFQVTPAGEIVWEWIGDRNPVISRTGAYPYDYCPQFANLPKSEIPVSLPAGARPMPRMSVGSSAGG